MAFQWRHGFQSASLSTFSISFTTILLPSAAKWMPSLHNSLNLRAKLKILSVDLSFYVKYFISDVRLYDTKGLFFNIFSQEIGKGNNFNCKEMKKTTDKHQKSNNLMRYLNPLSILTSSKVTSKLSFWTQTAKMDLERQNLCCFSIIEEPTTTNAKGFSHQKGLAI
jgi:hypothetical protein